MKRYLSSLQDRVDPEPSGPLVVDLEQEGTGELLGALSSETARLIVLALHEQPSTLSEAADAVGTSRQNAQYHLKRLEEVEAVRVVDTIYSDKGREMKVYAPAGAPLIIVSGEDGTGSKLQDSVANAFGLVLLAGILSAVVQVVSDRGWFQPEPSEEPIAHDGPTPEPTDANLVEPGTGERSEIESIEVTTADGDNYTFADFSEMTVVDASQTLWEAYPGLVFFLGALAALALVSTWRAGMGGPLVRRW